MNDPQDVRRLERQNERLRKELEDIQVRGVSVNLLDRISIRAGLYPLTPKTVLLLENK